MRFRSQSHVGVIFDAPDIEEQTFRAKLAFHSAKRVGGLVHIPQYAPYFVDGLGAGDHQIQVRRLADVFGNALQQQVTKKSAHDEDFPGAGKQRVQ